MDHANRRSAVSAPYRHAGLRRAAPAPLFAVISLLGRLAALPFANAVPIDGHRFTGFTADAPGAKDPKDSSLWVYLGTAIALVLLGGAFAGLTIALMGQDEIYLQVIATSGEAHERKHAKKVLRLMKKGKHWVLVTLLLANVITNETLPIVLDRSLGGGWPAVVSSTVLIVIFGEIAPQSVCVRYGLPIGAWMSPFVEALMWIMSPIAWPTAKLLDYILGEDHGTTYKKAGLKTLVTLHKTLGDSPDDRLNQDEVTIISAVLDLKDKPVGSIMTPMEDTFTMSADAVLDESMMDTILDQGYSRIPVHRPGNPTDFLGMLLVKMLITYDPEDALRVRDFALATLPETRPDTSCLDIINFFQEGKSHMVLVSEFPGEPKGALGVVTLEDVIEEVIGEEIIDESDVYIDVHKAIRRITPAPRLRVSKGAKGLIITDGTEVSPQSQGRKGSFSELSQSPTAATFLLRRRSSDRAAVPVRNTTPEMRERLKRLGPSNVASRPKQTRISAVKIKPGVETIPETEAITIDNSKPRSRPASRTQSLSESIVYKDSADGAGGVGEGLLASAGKEASDGVQALSQGYGTMSSSALTQVPETPLPPTEREETPKDTIASPKAEPDKIIIDNRPDTGNESSSSDVASHSTTGTLPKIEHIRSNSTKARSGSITQNVIAKDGARKIVLETTSSSDDDHAHAQVDGTADGAADANQAGSSATAAPKKKRKKRGGKKKNKGNGSAESEPLLGGQS